ncbi:MAG TPA: SRPBCC family protein [Candidatus Limnocylindria bacterium]
MTRLNERIRTPLPIEEAFAYLSDFANSEEWDPGVATAKRLGSESVGVGARYELGVRQGDRVVPMEYRITVFEPPTRVVLEGSGSRIKATDEIRFERHGDETLVDYTAEISLTGLLRLAQPFLGGTFRKIAENASDGIERTLAARAALGADRS